VVPTGTEVGYRKDGASRVRYAEPTGRRMFGDAPLGRIEVFARAPGYAEVTQTVVIEAGVPAETVLLLRPQR
jgi:hypothetical protein